MTMKLIQKDNRLMCLMRNNKESNNSSSVAEDLRKLTTEYMDEDTDTQSKIDALLQSMNDKDAFSD